MSDEPTFDHLPLDDGPAGDRPAREVSAAAAGSQWHLGVITRVFYGSGTGIVRSDCTGRELRFGWPFVDVRGPIERIDGLREGMRVGFDVGRTSRGLRVSVIRVLE